MTLLQKTKQLTQKIMDQRQQDTRNQLARTIRDRTASLENIIADLKSNYQKFTILQQMNHEVTLLSKISTDALDTYYTVGEYPVSIDNYAQNNWNDFKVRLNASQDNIKNSVKKDINRAKNNFKEYTSPVELDSFAADPITENTAKQLKQKRSNLLGIDWSIATPHDLQRLLTDVDKFRHQVDNLRKSGASEELRDFLRDVTSSHGVSLDALTEAIQEELKKRDLLSRIRLVLR